MNRPVRLTAVLTHPVQYYTPWFRHIAAHAPDIELTVVYATQPTAAQQGAGFGLPFQWDVPLTDGYPCQVVRPVRPGESVRSDRFWGLNVARMGTAVLATRPDVVLAPGWHSVTLLRAVLACRARGIPVLYRGDTHLDGRRAGWRDGAWTARTWTLLRLFDGYLAVGSRARAYLRRFGVSEARIFDVPHCVDNEFFARSARPHQTPAGRAAARESWGLGAHDFVVLFAGKLEPKKRPLDLVGAVARMRPGACLLIAGTGELERRLREEAAKLGVSVGWAGFLNQSEMPRAYAAADCLALPSDWGESWGLVVNEALAAGLPCVVSDRVGSGPDLVMPGETGEVFPAGDEAALTHALERVRERGRTGHLWAPACRARAAVHSFGAATAGLLSACRAMAHPRAVCRSRVLVYGGGMVIVAGLERMIFEVLDLLRSRGAAVHWIVNRWENHRIVALAERIGASWSTTYHWYPLDRHTRNPVRLIQMAWDTLMTSLGVLCDARRFRPTHVLLPDFTSVLRTAPALLLLRLWGVPVILRLGNAPDAGPFYRRLWRWGVNPCVSWFVCNSHFTERELLAHGVPAGKVCQIYNTLPSRAEHGLGGSHRDPGKCIYIGQIIPDKGLHVLLEAVGLLVAWGCDVRLDVVGQMDGWVSPAYEGYREGLLARAAEPDLAGRVHFLGWREDVPSLLAGAAVHCCPSLPAIREGFGLVNIEAKQAGIPSVVFPTGALPELIAHRRDGWICRAATAEALAEGLAYFLLDAGRREEAGRAARVSLERFSQGRFAQAWWAVLGEPPGSTARRSVFLAHGHLAGRGRGERRER